MNIDFFIQTLFDNTALIGTFFMLSGIIKIFIYYKLFNLYIFDFFDIKEVLTLFSNNLLAYFTIIIVVIFMYYNASFEGYYKYIAPILILIFIILYLKLRSNIYWYETSFQIILLAFIYFSIYYLRNNINFIAIGSDKLHLYFLSIILISLVLFSIFSGINEFIKVKFKKYYSKIVIDINGTEFKSSNEKYYIGKTDKYVFIYDSSNKSCIVYPSSEIKKIIFKYS